MELASPVETRLTAMQEGHDLSLELFGVGVVSSDDFPEDHSVSLDDLRGEIRHRRLQILCDTTPLAFEYEQPDAENSPFMSDRFEIYDEDCVNAGICGLEHFVMCDKHSGTEYEMSYKELLLPNFDTLDGFMRRNPAGSMNQIVVEGLGNGMVRKIYSLKKLITAVVMVLVLGILVIQTKAKTVAQTPTRPWIIPVYVSNFE